MNDIIKTTENKIIGKLSTAIITGTLVAITGAALFCFLDGIKDIDVIAEGEYIPELNDNTLHWVGSSNQRVIKVKESTEDKLSLIDIFEK